MNKQALLEETYRSAFEDELEKVALGTAGKLIAGGIGGGIIASGLHLMKNKRLPGRVKPGMRRTTPFANKPL